MAVFQVTSPSGENYEVNAPDDATEDQVHAYAMQNFGGGQPASTPSGPTDDQVDQSSKTSRFIQGIKDPANAIGQMMLHSAEIVSPGLTGGADKYLDRDLDSGEKNYQASRQATGNDGVDWMRMLGGMVSTAPVAAAIPGAGAEALGTRVASGIASGVTNAALQPVTDSTQSFGDQKRNQALIGGAVGGALPMAGEAVARVIRPNTSEAVQTLLDSGVTPTPGQILGGGFKGAEEKLTSVPLVGDTIASAQRRVVEDVNRASYDDALSHIGEKLEGNVGREGVQETAGKLKNAYDEVIPKTLFKVDDGFKDAVGTISSQIQDLPETQVGTFQKIMRNQLLSKVDSDGNIAGDKLKGVLSELRRRAEGLKGDPSWDQRELGSAIGATHDAINESLVRNSPEGVGQALGNVNAGWAKYARIREAAARPGSKEGVFTPDTLQSVVRNADKSVGRGNFAKGNALMQDLSESASKVAGGKYPDSGTAGRLLHTSPLLWPIFAGAKLAAAIPYSQTGQKVFANAMTQRPDFAAPLANGIRNNAYLMSSPIIRSLLSGGG